MNRFKNVLALAALSLLVLCLPSFASAQWGGGNNRGGDNRGGGYYGGNIKNTISSLKYHAKNFERQTDNFDDRRDDRNDRWGNNRGGNNSDRIEDLADDFAKAADRLEDKYGNGRNLNGSRDEAQRVLNLASRIDQALSRSRGSNQLRNSWNQMRGELSVIARTYGGNYNDNGRDRRNNRRNNYPFPF